jgi:hypothetical protein
MGEWFQGGSSPPHPLTNLNQIKMKTSIKKELSAHIIDKINDGVIDNTNKDDWHFYCFNEDYYIIYHSVALEWLKSHDIDAFEAIEIVREYEVDNFGEMNTDIDPESIVNMLAYIYGEELLNSIDAENIEELKNRLTDEV